MLLGPTSENLTLFGSDGKVMIWRTSGKEFDSKCTIPTVKHSGDLGLFHQTESCKTVCIGSYHGQILLSRYFGSKFATIDQSF